MLLQTYDTPSDRDHVDAPPVRLVPPEGSGGPGSPGDAIALFYAGAAAVAVSPIASAYFR